MPPSITPARLYTNLTRTLAATQPANVPGFALGILTGNKTFAHGFGITSVENPLPITDTTLFRIASITKTLTATAVLRLVDVNQLELAAPVRKYLPDLRLQDRVAQDRVTIRDLFLHIAGWQGDVRLDTGSGDDALTRYVQYLADVPQLTPFGIGWSYNNAAVNLAGRVIEIVTGQNYEMAMQTLVFAPLQMNHTFFSAEIALTYRCATGHRLDKVTNTLQVARPYADPRTENPSGGAISCITDMLNYARMLCTRGQAPDGKLFLRPATFDVLQTIQGPADVRADAMALAWFIKDVGGQRLFFHRGKGGSQVSEITLVPEKQFAVCVLTNSESGEGWRNQVIYHALNVYLGLAEKEPTVIASLQSHYQDYTGVYVEPAAEIKVETTAAKLKLHIRFTTDWQPFPTPPPMEIGFYKADTFMVVDGPLNGAKGEFVRDEHSRVEWLRIAGRLHQRQKAH